MRIFRRKGIIEDMAKEVLLASKRLHIHVCVVGLKTGIGDTTMILIRVIGIAVVSKILLS